MTTRRQFLAAPLGARLLHARPAAAFVRAAAPFASTVRLENVTLGHPSADAKSIVGVLSAGVERGHLVRIAADGVDEDQALDALRDLLAGLGEPGLQQRLHAGL